MRDRPDGRGRIAVRLPVSMLVAGALAGMVIPGASARAQVRGAGPAGEPVIVVDLRAAGAADRERTRRALDDAVSGDARLRLAPLDPALAALLHGPAETAPQAALARFEPALDRAAALRSSGDCTAALDAAGEAIAGLAAEQAALAAPPPAPAPAPTQAPELEAVTQALEAAYGDALACAHQLGDTGRALGLAQRLRALRPAAAGPPPGVSEELWRAYPAVDALGNAAIVEMAITTEPAGAQVWLDHRHAGASPVTVLVSEGAHLVAAAGEDRAGGVHVQVSQAALPRVAWGQPQVMRVHLPLAPRPWRAEAAAVARWRSAGAVDPAALADLLVRLDVRFALVLVDTDARLLRSGAPSAQAAQIWARGPAGAPARRVGTGQLARPGAIARRLAARAASGAPDPRVARASDRPGRAGLASGAPLLREQDVPGRFGSRPGRRPVARQPWWAYVTIIGAVAATSLLIVAADLGDDRQRIEVRWP